MVQSGSDALRIGTRLANGRYVIEAVLGKGGFGITYRATDTMLNRTVAIKELFPDSSDRVGNRVSASADADDWSDETARFLREARTLASLDHPSIVNVYDYFRENNTAYMVMKFVAGEDLSKLLVRRGPLPEAEVLRYVNEVGQALVALHAMHLLHRDLKPQNIMLTQQGRVVLVDFGAAREFKPDVSHTLTRIGTTGFTPLEQWMGHGDWQIPIGIVSAGS